MNFVRRSAIMENQADEASERNFHSGPALSRDPVPWMKASQGALGGVSSKA